MRRRDFIRALALAPVALAAAKYLPESKPEWETLGQISGTRAEWMPSTAYSVGDVVTIRGGKFSGRWRVTAAGTSGPNPSFPMGTCIAAPA